MALIRFNFFVEDLLACVCRSECIPLHFGAQTLVHIRMVWIWYSLRQRIQFTYLSRNSLVLLRFHALFRFRISLCILLQCTLLRKTFRQNHINVLTFCLNKNAEQLFLPPKIWCFNLLFMTIAFIVWAKESEMRWCKSRRHRIIVCASCSFICFAYGLEKLFFFSLFHGFCCRRRFYFKILDPNTCYAKYFDAINGTESFVSNTNSFVAKRIEQPFQLKAD